MKNRYPPPLLFRVQCNTTTIMFNSFLHISQQNPKENGKRNTWQYKLTSRLSGIFYGLLSQGNFHIIKNESNRSLLKMHFYPPGWFLKLYIRRIYFFWYYHTWCQKSLVFVVTKIELILICHQERGKSRFCVWQLSPQEFPLSPSEDFMYKGASCAIYTLHTSIPRFGHFQAGFFFVQQIQVLQQANGKDTFM